MEEGYAAGAYMCSLVLAEKGEPGNSLAYTVGGAESGLSSRLYLLRVAGSARGGTAESGQGYVQDILWACLSV